MIGILYNAFYIEKYFPWAVQKYKDKDGEPTKALYGIPVNASSCNSLWGCAHTVEGPVYSNFSGTLNECYVIKSALFEGAVLPKLFFNEIIESPVLTSTQEEEKKSHKVTIHKLTKEGKNHSLITDDLINIADLKWWSIDEKIPPVGLPIILCVKERPSTSNCSPYNTFPAKYCYDSTNGKYIFIGMGGEYYWYLTEDDFRWTVDAGRCPDF